MENLELLNNNITLTEGYLDFFQGWRLIHEFLIIRGGDGTHAPSATIKKFEIIGKKHNNNLNMNKNQI